MIFNHTHFLGKLQMKLICLMCRLSFGPSNSNLFAIDNESNENLILICSSKMPLSERKLPHSSGVWISKGQHFQD
jgi:hypothetical protein